MLPDYLQKKWLLTSWEIVYDRRQISPEIANGYKAEILAATSGSSVITEFTLDLWIQDPTDPLNAGVKAELDYYNIVRANVNFTAHKDVSAKSITTTILDGFKALKGLTSAPKIYFTNSDFIPGSTSNDIVLNGVTSNFQKNKMGIIEIQWTEFGYWTVEEVTSGTP